MTRKTIIVSGINGQLGQHMAKHLLDHHPEVTIIGTTRHRSFSDQEYIFDRSRITVDLMDLSDAHSIESVIVKHKPEYFVNTAANAFVGESWQVPAQHFEINALAVLHQLEAIRKHSPHTRYLNSGTSEEFGAVEYSPQDEKHRLIPRSPYGAAKCAARHLVRVWRESYSLYAIQGWTFNFESEIRGEKYVTRKITKGVARIAHAIQRGLPFDPIELGNLDSKRSWQYAGDVADGLWRMLNQTGAPQEYVISAPDTHSVREFVEVAFKEAGLAGKWVRNGVDPAREAFHWDADGHRNTKLVVINPAFYRPAEVAELHGDSTRARAELGWSPKVTFPELVHRMVAHDLSTYHP